MRQTTEFHHYDDKTTLERRRVVELLSTVFRLSRKTTDNFVAIVTSLD